MVYHRWKAFGSSRAGKVLGLGAAMVTGGVFLHGSAWSPFSYPVTHAWVGTMAKPAREPGQTWTEKDSEMLLSKSSSVMPLHKCGVSTVHLSSLPANVNMEDRHDMKFFSNGKEAPDKQALYVGVYDGHGGPVVSTLLQHYLINRVRETHVEALKGPADQDSVINAFKASFVDIDKEIIQHESSVVQGACAALVCVTGDKNLIAAHVGDCRVVMGEKNKKTGAIEAVALTKDHRIKGNPEERKRLQMKYPNEPDIVARDRVKGRLEPTRAFGDAYYKTTAHNHLILRRYHFPEASMPYITAEPDVKILDMSAKNNDASFVVVATDGLFDFLSNEEIVQHVSDYVHNNRSVSARSSVSGLNAARHLVEKMILKVTKTAFVHDAVRMLEEDVPANIRRAIHDDTTVAVIFFEKESQFTSDAMDSNTIQSKL